MFQWMGKERLKNGLRKVYYEKLHTYSASSSSYWNEHNVTVNRAFLSWEESLEYFHWRNDQYYNYIDLMPVSGHDGLEILDYGCGPGNDIVGLLHYSRPKRVVGCDVSERSLAEARARIALHDTGNVTEFVTIDESDGRLPFPDDSFDYVHSSGVLHHVPRPQDVLGEFRRVLRPGGKIRVMVYNYDSVWLHLYVAYQQMILFNRYPGMSVRDVFARFTDGEDCPIANVYRPSEFIDMGAKCGLSLRFLGSSVSQHEMKLLPMRHQAIQDPRLRMESRRFLMELTVDERALPMIGGVHAGIGAEFESVDA